jgi:hypothetical protein
MIRLLWCFIKTLRMRWNYSIQNFSCYHRQNRVYVQYADKTFNALFWLSHATCAHSVKIIQCLCFEWWYVQLPVELKELSFIFSTRYRLDRSEARSNSCTPTLSTGYLPGIKWPEPVADFPPPSSAGFRMDRSYTCTYPLWLYKYDRVDLYLSQ